MLNYLACPYCRGQELSLKAKKIICRQCQKTFNVVEGIPILMKSSYLGEQEEGQREWFDDHYSRFSSRKYQLENWRLSMLKRIFETDFQKKIKTYLDIGCGATGYTVIEAAKRFSWLSFGIDISLEAMLRARNLACQQGVEEKTGFLVCSAENLPFQPNLFDYVSVLGVLEHLENDRQVIKSVADITKGGGHFCLCVPNTYKRIWPFLWPIYFYLDKKIGHQRHYSIEGLSEKMKKEGFKLEKAFYNGHLIKLFQFILEKMRLINDENWWRLEEKDINQNSIALQLNAIYQKA